MKKHLLTLTFSLLLFAAGTSQTFYQYFDGADTTECCSTFYEIDTSASNIWQVGKPQKTFFNLAATAPNVLITDTVNFYPVNNTSSCTVRLYDYYNYNWGIWAIQWAQRLDIEPNEDAGYVEYSTDKMNWVNAFNSPFVYNFYGFDNSNVDTLTNGDFVFSGKDTLWRDIWLCFDMSFVTQFDSMWVRFTLKTDSNDNSREGWMIDNLMSRVTLIHTAKQKESDGKYLHVWPSLTDGIVNIEAEKKMEYHIIEDLQIVDAMGRIVEQYKNVPTKFFVDLRKYGAGIYYVKVKTNFDSGVFPVVLTNKG